MAIQKSTIEESDRAAADLAEEVIDSILKVRWNGSDRVLISAYDIASASHGKIKSNDLNEKIFKMVASRYASEWTVRTYSSSIEFS